MTDKTDSPSPADDVDKPDNGALIPVQNAPPPKGGRSCRRAASLVVAALILVLLLLLALGWFGSRQLQELRAQLAAQWAQSTQNQAAVVQAQDQARRALDTLQTQAALLSSLQADTARLAAQLQNLEQTVESAAPVTDSPALLLGEAGRLVDIAQQAVRLDGNVATALIALESAQARLAQRSEFTGLHLALQGDIDRLRAAPLVDVPVLASRLDALSALIDQAPLLLPESARDVAPVPEPEPAAPTDVAYDASAQPASWWEGAWRQTRQWSRLAWRMFAHDVRGLIQVQRIDDASALLISPNQAADLRETLQRRVATARLALLMRQPALWNTELGAVQQALDARFDARDTAVQQAGALVLALRNTAITVALPDLSRSVRAVQAQREIVSRVQPDNSDNPSGSGGVQLPAENGQN